MTRLSETTTRLMTSASCAIFCGVLLFLLSSTAVDAFMPRTTNLQSRTGVATLQKSPSSAMPFATNTRRRVAGGQLYNTPPANGESSSEAPRDDAAPSSDENDDNDDNDDSSAMKSRAPFFARIKEALQRKKENDSDETTVPSLLQAAAPTPSPTTTAAAAVDSSSSSTSSSAAAATEPAIPETPAQIASRYKAQAEKIRLEADRLDAELTLAKIDRLERDISAAQKVDDVKSKQRLEQLVAEMDVLQRKLQGEPAVVVAPFKPTVSSSPSTAPSATSSSSSRSKTESASPPRFKVKLDILPTDEKDVETVAKELEIVPGFVLKAMASTVALDYETAEDVNKTELAIRLDKLRRNDFSFVQNKPAPEFTLQQIEERVQEIRDGSFEGFNSLPFDMAKSEETNGESRNETEYALQSLQFEYYLGDQDLITDDDMEKIIRDEEWLQPVIAAFNKTAIDVALESLYPVCTRKPDMLPTEAQVQQLAMSVLPKAGFSSSSKPEPVTGGYIIRGKTKLEDANKLIDAIDAELAKTSLDGKLTVVYTPDYSAFVDEEAMEQVLTPDDIPSILYVMGPDIAREQRRVALSITSAFGLATSWYLSIYPYLLNTGLAKRIEDDLALVDSGMTPDLSWLTDLSIPLFATFVGIQVFHEVGHRLAAAANGVKLTTPAFVPSVITGITGTVTSFKTPPKNLNAMFDIAIAGPLVGMVASVAAIAIGASLTLGSDPNILPALPLQILRQSTLGGGLIESFLGAGVLAVPNGAENSAQIAAITIPLHPLAVAGYISLIINALALVPVGTTDGGRVALTLFGRGAKLLIGNTFLAALFCIGASGSDLFLFYFGFVLAFQTGNEIPSRNEVDPLSFERVLVATAGIVLMLLTLIPFQ